MSKHPHAELMAQYAQDALEMEEPWERWEVKRLRVDGIGSAWITCSSFEPMFDPGMEYRRKPKLESKTEYSHKYVRILECGSAETVDSLLDATHICIFTKDSNGFERRVYNLELPETLLAIFNTHKKAVELYDKL